MTQTPIVIVGGGIAGLACARTLYDAGRSFVMITERLGGRIYAESGMSWGAKYITKDYHEVRKFCDDGLAIRIRDVYFETVNGPFSLFRRGGLKNFPKLMNVLRDVACLRCELLKFRKQARGECQKHVLQDYPLIQRWMKLPAKDYVAQQGLCELHEKFIHPILRATFFVTVEEVNTLFYLSALFPTWVCAYEADFTETLSKLGQGFGNQIWYDRVMTIGQEGGCFYVQTPKERFEAEAVVLATPVKVVEKLLTGVIPRVVPQRMQEVVLRTNPFGVYSEEPFHESSVCVLAVEGERKPIYEHARIVMTARDEPVLCLWKNRDGSDTVYVKGSLSTSAADPSILENGKYETELKPQFESLKKYYSNFKIRKAVHWRSAITISGPSWHCLNPQENLFVIGDHNICGLEDSFLTGQYAANVLLHKAEPCLKKCEESL
ncbi:MAG: FAD-dependent oxidoreductase [Deltaproteobacteria bacterium]|nr:FAD-dependent oxidoreductase [Deltaproteobacteria bacterium]